MSENSERGFTAIAVSAVLGAVAIVGGIIWGMNQAHVLAQEVKLACIENGGTWIDWQSMCLAENVKVTE